MNTKVCTKCGEEKPVSEFGKKKASKDGLHYYCKPCNNTYVKKWAKENPQRKAQADLEWRNANKELKKLNDSKYYKANKNKIADYQKEYYLRNKQKVNSRGKRYYENNKERLLNAQRKWANENPESVKNSKKRYRKRNREKVLALTRKRQLSKLKRTPKWLTDHHYKLIEDFYKKARELSEKTNVKYVVDHIIPLQGKKVSGLHVPWNLQVITRKENSVKSNKLEEGGCEITQTTT